jgi:hypothetical protein
MSQFIPDSFSQEYAANVELLLQQKPSRFRMASRTSNYTGRSAEVVQQIGAMELVDKDVRHKDTTIIDVPHSVRWVHPKDKNGAVLLDSEDELKTLANFESPYTETGRSAANRAIDREFLRAAFSNTTVTGVDQDVIVSWDTFVAANPLHQIAHGGTGLSAAKIKQGLKALRAAEVDLERERVYMGVSAEQIEDMELEDQYINYDFTSSRNLETTSVKPFLGVNFIHSELMADDGGTARRCPMWVASGMAVGFWNDIKTRVDERPDKDYATQVFIELSMGATRVEEKKIVEIQCTE